jgi:SPOR domain
MKGPAALVFIWVIFIFIGTGCSGEGPSSSPEENVVVRRPIEAVPQGKAETGTANLDVNPREAGERVSAVEDKARKKKEEGQGGIEKGYYITERGDSLAKIARRKDVYGDRLKWPIIYRLNMDVLDGLAMDLTFPDAEIPAGIRLKIVSSLKVQENLTKRPKDYWIINVLSAREEEVIVPYAIKLIRNGYPAYITTADINGKEWMRLRVGFYGQKEVADREGEKLMEILGFTDIWTTKVGDIERGEFGGY